MCRIVCLCPDVVFGWQQDPFATRDDTAARVRILKQKVLWTNRRAEILRHVVVIPQFSGTLTIRYLCVSRHYKPGREIR